jgi:hypothetical protein
MQVDKYILGFGCSFGLAALVAACAVHSSEPYEQHCWNAMGDSTCMMEFGIESPYCSHDESPCFAGAPLGCVATRPVLDECYSPCGEGQSIVENPGCDGVADEVGTGDGDSESTSGESTESGTTESEWSESESESTETDSTESDSTEAETTGDDCGGCDAPMFCHEGMCVECTPDLQEPCFATQEWCDPEHGFSCVPCTNHFQCFGGAGCHLEFGTCLPHDRVYNVPGDWSLDEALSELDGQDGTVRISDSSSYSRESTFYLAQDQIVVVVAAGEVRPVIDRKDGEGSPDYAFNVAAGDLYLWGIDFSGVAGVRISDTGKLHAERTAFDNARAAVYLSGGEANLRSCMLISDNDSMSPTLGITGSGFATIVFSTILARSGDNALECNSGSTVSIRNGILGSFQNDNGITIFNCGYLILDSAVEDTDVGFVVVFPPEAVVGPFLPSDFVDPATGNLHLAPDPGPEFESIAHWSIGDPLDDFDGEPRVTQGATWAGADHPQ